MAEKKFTGAPFGNQTARFDVSGVHPKTKVPGTFTQISYDKNSMLDQQLSMAKETVFAAYSLPHNALLKLSSFDNHLRNIRESLAEAKSTMRVIQNMKATGGFIQTLKDRDQNTLFSDELAKDLHENRTSGYKKVRPTNKKRSKCGSDKSFSHHLGSFPSFRSQKYTRAIYHLEDYNFSHGNIDINSVLLNQSGGHHLDLDDEQNEGTYDHETAERNDEAHERREANEILENNVDETPDSKNSKRHSIELKNHVASAKISTNLQETGVSSNIDVVDNQEHRGSFKGESKKHLTSSEKIDHGSLSHEKHLASSEKIDHDSLSHEQHISSEKIYPVALSEEEHHKRESIDYKHITEDVEGKEAEEDEKWESLLKKPSETDNKRKSADHKNGSIASIKSDKRRESTNSTKLDKKGESRTRIDKKKESINKISVDEEKKSIDKTKSVTKKQSIDTIKAKKRESIDKTKLDKKRESTYSTQEDKKRESTYSTHGDKKRESTFSTQGDKKRESTYSTHGDKKRESTFSTQGDKKRESTYSTHGDKKRESTFSAQGNKKRESTYSTQGGKKSKSICSTQENKKRESTCSTQGEKRKESLASSKSKSVTRPRSAFSHTVESIIEAKAETEIDLAERLSFDLALEQTNLFGLDAVIEKESDKRQSLVQTASISSAQTLSTSPSGEIDEPMPTTKSDFTLTSQVYLGPTNVEQKEIMIQAEAKIPTVYDVLTNVRRHVKGKDQGVVIKRLEYSDVPMAIQVPPNSLVGEKSALEKIWIKIRRKPVIESKDLCDDILKRKLGPETYNDMMARFGPKEIEKKPVGHGWARQLELERRAALPHILYKDKWEQNKLLGKKLGPGSYELKDFIQLANEKPGSARGICYNLAPRFEKGMQSATPGPGTYGVGGVPQRALEDKSMKSMSTKGLLDAGDRKRNLPSVGSHLGPGTYNFKSSTDELINKVVSTKGPYELFSGDRNQPISVGFFAAPKLANLGPGYYETSSFLDELNAPHQKFKGNFSKRPQYPDVPTERFYLFSHTHFPKKKDAPGPGSYTVQDISKPEPVNSPAFLSSASRDDKLAQKFFTRNFNTVGAGRYDIQKFEESQDVNGHTNVFKSKTVKPNVKMTKILEERLQNKTLRVEDRVVLYQPQRTTRSTIVMGGLL